MAGRAIDVLLAIGDAVIAASMEKTIAGLGHRVTVANTVKRAVELADQQAPDLAILAAGIHGDPGAGDLAKHCDLRSVPFVLTAAGAQEMLPLVPFHPLATVLQPFRDGELELVLSVAQDQVAQRQQSAERSRNLNGIVDGLLDSVLVINGKQQVVFSNATAQRQMQGNSLQGMELQHFFPAGGAGNEALLATVNAARSGSGGIGSGSRATLRVDADLTVPVVVIVNSIKDAAGAVTGVSISFRPANQPAEDPSVAIDEVQTVETSESTEAADALHAAAVQNTPLRAKAIRSIEAGLNSDSPTHKHYVVVLLLSQFDMFRLRYGLNNAEKLVHAFSAHLIKSLPPEDRLYSWSNRTVVVLLERESAIDEVRLEMTAFCSRRVDYYLNATGRSALVTLSASWHLIPLFDCPEAKRDSRRIIEQIDAFERSHTRRK